MTKPFHHRAAALLIATAVVGLAVPSLAAEWGPKSDTNPRPAFIGVYPTDLDKDRREALEFSGDGILVEDVVEDGPAEKAGIKAGDIVTKIDGDAIKSSEDFRAAVRKHQPGEKVKVVLLRDGTEQEFTALLARRPSDSFSFRIPDFGNDDDGRGFLGVVTETLEEDLAEYFEVKSGALVKSVEDDSPAAKAGLNAGDVLVKIGKEKIESADDVHNAVRRHQPGAEVPIVFVRKGKEQTVEVTLGEAIDSSSRRWSGPGRHRIIIKDDDEVTIDTEELRETIRDALSDVKIHFDDDREQMREEIHKLRQELDELRQRLEGKKADKKEEPKNN